MIDLHLHIDGSLPEEVIRQLAFEEGISLDNYSGINPFGAPPVCEGLNQYLKYFELPLRLLQGERSIEYAVYSLAKKLWESLIYAELRFAPQLHTAGNLSQAQAVEAALKGLERALKESKGFYAQLILCCMRGNDNGAANIETLECARAYRTRSDGEQARSGVCAVDLAGAEGVYATLMFERLFARAAQMGLDFTIHAGEDAGADSVERAIAFGARRIGHGIRARQNVPLMNRLAKEKIALELCPTSNLQTRAVKAPRDYPLEIFIDTGIVTTINTDNMTVSNTDIFKEYSLVSRLFGLDRGQVLSLMKNAAESAFAHKTVRASLARRVEKADLSRFV